MDERIVMCMEETYPEHEFSVKTSFDKSKDCGVFQDETVWNLKCMGWSMIIHIISDVKMIIWRRFCEMKIMWIKRRRLHRDMDMSLSMMERE